MSSITGSLVQLPGDTSPEPKGPPPQLEQKFMYVAEAVREFLHPGHLQWLPTVIDFMGADEEANAPPAFALVLGSGTTAMQAVIDAITKLPNNSFIMLTTRQDVKYARALQTAISQTLQHHLPDLAGNSPRQFTLQIVDSLDLRNETSVSDFLRICSGNLRGTRLVYATADKAYRDFSNELNLSMLQQQQALQHGIYRILYHINNITDVNKTLYVEWINSECGDKNIATPNIEHHSLAKQSARELFCRLPKRENSLWFMPISGAMRTKGQIAARRQEFDWLQQTGQLDDKSATFENYLKTCAQRGEIAAAASTGKMRRLLWDAVAMGGAQFGAQYCMLSDSVVPQIPGPRGVLIPYSAPAPAWPAMGVEVNRR